MSPTTASRLPVLAFLTLVLAAPAFSAAEGDAELDDLAWLAGHWRIEREGAVTEELWTEPAGGLMLAVNRQVRPGRRGSFEYLRIEQGPEGLRYVASPGGGPATAFGLARSGERHVVFENREHDWPQVVEYRLDEEGAMHVRAAGLEEGDRELVWTMERVRAD